MSSVKWRPFRLNLNVLSTYIRSLRRIVLLTRFNHYTNNVNCSRVKFQFYHIEAEIKKMAAISQTTLSNAFSWMKMLEFRLKFHWSLFLSAQLTIFQHWFRWWLGADQSTSYYLNQWWLLTHICVTRPQWHQELAFKMYQHPNQTRE